MLKILHTSDWHLGRSLYGQNRHAEFAAFLDWLMQTLQQERVDVLMIAGDVFDTITPNHAAQELYYRFLAQVSAYCLCRHIIIIGGNHDSASFLNAPKALLFALNVHVIGAATNPIDKEVLVLKNAQGEPAAIVCAVPYLRDRDVRLSVDGESSQDKSLALTQGIKDHYRQALAIAEHKQQELGSNAPIIAMGHLFSQGGMTLDADGVRELYVGSLAHIGADCFDGFDYVALGHLHVPQAVGGQAHIRYCGSPIPMGFGEAKQQKQVLHVAFTGRLPEITAINIPNFQVLQRIQGDLPHIQAELKQLMQSGSTAYIEVVYQGNELVADLSEKLDAQVQGSDLRLLRVYNRQFVNNVLASASADATLPDLNPTEVFEACMAQHDLDDAQKAQFRDSYQHVLHQVEQPEEDEA
ncbi:MAG: exonuclease SbcCD subunit D C-terminal domain-containing protein [Vitreoscilla sp.]|nr:exonuclease SbcCD subunit D C-terminal domain-containing protein [Vitreoscilla sp.]